MLPLISDYLGMALPNTSKSSFYLLTYFSKTALLLCHEPIMWSVNSVDLSKILN